MTLPDDATLAAAGPRMTAQAARLWPICRSIAGPGLRETLRVIGESLPLRIIETPTGTPVFDWKVPQEWTLRHATLHGPDGALIVDTDVCNLGVVNFSVPTRGIFTLDELRPRLHALPDKPDVTPYRTSYHLPTWGFCLPHRTLDALRPGNYAVNIDTTLADGALSIGELVIPGTSTDEVLFSTHCCHPSLANDNLSGIAVATELAAALLRGPTPRYTYRFLFLPGTIGAITWLAQNLEGAARIKNGLVLSCLGDGGAFTYKQSRRGDAEIDRAVAVTLADVPHAIREYIPYGYDERQYGSPGLDLPVGCLMRTPHGEYPEYHTSADDLSFLSETRLVGSLRLLLSIVDVLERNGRFVNQNPFCEPQLGRRGLYASLGGHAHAPQLQLALLWVLNYSDGRHDLIDIARRAKLPIALVCEAAERLGAVELLKPANR